jgi:hypothetical protein
MFNLFNRKAAEKPGDVKAVREALIVFIKQELQKLEGGEGGNIRGFQLYIACAAVEKYMYESAVFTEDPARFKNEVQRVADDFAIDLPEKWTLETVFVDVLPAGLPRAEQIEAALEVKTHEVKAVEKPEVAYIKVLTGETEQPEYKITAAQGRINIGRDRQAQVKDGHVRLNDIAFPSDSRSAENKYVSRQHAHIDWNSETGTFMLFADEGGIPPGNKLKISSAEGHQPIKITFIELGHELREGDQIILGDSAVLTFSYHTN